MENPQIELARRYVEQTGVSVFLTGKAGTGKTTFLREIDRTTTKRHVVVAPTGVAAINAGGVTIHSFFQLPFDPYLPEVKELVTEYQMPDRYKTLSKNKLNIIRTLELLIIDEISMVRADLLDAIDMTLRRARRSSRPFGGVQLLMIGDVHQLSPVVTETERPFMENVYPTPYFFASKALQQLPYVTIELTTVYRQQDAAFVELLNHVRDNNIDAATLQALNARVQNTQAITQSHNQAITLTTHNRQADAINRRHMEALQGERRLFEAVLKGNYPEKALPCDRTLEVKVGERVMFVKNDSSGGHRYYNGMLGTVTSLTPTPSPRGEGCRMQGYPPSSPLGEGSGGEAIEVISDDGDVIQVGREVWESLKYTIDPATKEITQEVEGTFSQYPLQAAWAVTIHKAQGLTFDRVVIDAADAFAFGQVYVALSRCRTLEGLTLSTPLTAGVAFDDASVYSFVHSQPTFEQTAEAAGSYEQQYRMEKLMELFSIDLRDADRLLERYTKLKNLYPDNLERLGQLNHSLADLQNVSERFKSQLMQLDEAAQNERAAKGADYYRTQLQAARYAYAALLDVEIDNKEVAQAVREAGEQLTESLGLKLACLDAVLQHGYSVATVQKAKADYMIGDVEEEKGKGRKKREKKERPAKEPKAAKTGTPKEPHPDLITLLRQWRAAKAKEEGIATYMVLQQKAVLAIAAAMPRTPAELMQLNGIGDKTVEKYGKELLDLVADFRESGQGW